MTSSSSLNVKVIGQSCRSQEEYVPLLATDARYKVMYTF